MTRPTRRGAGATPTTRRCTTRALVPLVAVLAVLGFVGAACGDDDGDATTTSAAEASGESPDEMTDDTSGDPPGAGTATDGEFEEQVGEVAATIEAVSDPCDLFDAIGSSSLPDPSTPAQVEVAVGFIVTLVDKMAELTTDAGLAEQLRAAGQSYEDYFAGSDFDPETFLSANADSDDPALADFDAAQGEWFDTAAAECMPGMADEPSGTDEVPADP